MRMILPIPSMHSSSRWTVTFYIGPPQPEMGAIGATGKCHQQRLYSLTTLDTTWLQVLLKLDWRKNLEMLAKFWPLGPPLLFMNSLWIPGPWRMIPANVWIHSMLKKKLKQLRKGPTMTLGTAMKTFVLHLKVSTHLTWLFSFWINAWFWPFGALPLGPHGGPHVTIWTTESPTPLIPAIFG